MSSSQQAANSAPSVPDMGGILSISSFKTQNYFMVLELSFKSPHFIPGLSRDSPLAVDMPTAILHLSEDGDLKIIRDKWLLKSACSSADIKQALSPRNCLLIKLR